MPRISLTSTIGALLAGGWLAATTAACDSPGDNAFSDCSRGACDPRDGGGGRPHDGGTGGPRPESGSLDAGPSRSLLCGVSGCFPGNRSACGATPGPDAALHASFLTDASWPDDADCDGCEREENAQHDASTDGIDATNSPDAMDLPDTSPDDAEGDPRDAGASIDASAPDDAPDHIGDTGTSDEPQAPQSCYIQPSPAGVFTECAPVGSGAEGSACNDSSDCGALLVCVVVDQKSACHRVWCALPASCLTGSFYQEAPLRVRSITRQEVVPVCLPTDNCALLAQPNPCPSGKVCAVVGSEGETTCVVPGTGRVGEMCDEAKRCTEGLLCSKFANQCVKICRVDSGATDCPTGTCQGGNRSLPDGFGICVGETADSG